MFIWSVNVCPAVAAVSRFGQPGGAGDRARPLGHPRPRCDPRPFGPSPVLVSRGGLGSDAPAGFQPAVALDRRPLRASPELVSRGMAAPLGGTVPRCFTWRGAIGMPPRGANGSPRTLAVRRRVSSAASLAAAPCAWSACAPLCAPIAARRAPTLGKASARTFSQRGGERQPSTHARCVSGRLAGEGEEGEAKRPGATRGGRGSARSAALLRRT